MMVLKLDICWRRHAVAMVSWRTVVLGPRVHMTSSCHVASMLTRHQAGGWTAGLVITVLAVILTDGIFTMDLHVLPERGRMGVGLVTTSHLAVVGFVRGVNVRMLLTITRVCKPTIAAVKLTFERFLTWKKEDKTD